MNRHIFVITPYPMWPVTNGGARYVEYIISKLLRDGNVVTLFLPEPKEKRIHETIPGVKAVYYQSLHPYHHFVNFPLIQALYRECFENRPDGIVINYPFQFLMVHRIAKQFKIPVTVVAHNIEFLRFRSMKKYFLSIIIFFSEWFALRCSSHVWAITHRVREQITAIFHFESEVVSHIPDPNIFKVISESESRELKRSFFPDFKKIVLFFGNLQYSPNREAVHFLNDVIAKEVFERDKEIQFLIVGEGHPRKIYMQNVMTIGYVENIQEYIYAADVVAIPVYQGGGVNIKALEVIACGKPLFVSTFVADGLDEDLRRKVKICARDEFAGLILDFFRKTAG